MIDLPLSQTGSGLLTLAILVAMFALFLRERWPTEVVAIGGVALLLILGLLPADRATEVLANPAPWTIAAMFIVMGALVRTGSLDRLTKVRRGQGHLQPRPRGRNAAGLRRHRLGLR